MWEDASAATTIDLEKLYGTRYDPQRYRFCGRTCDCDREVPIIIVMKSVEKFNELRRGLVMSDYPPDTRGIRVEKPPAPKTVSRRPRRQYRQRRIKIWTAPAGYKRVRGARGS